MRLWRINEDGKAVDALTCPDTFALCNPSDCIMDKNDLEQLKTALTKRDYAYACVWSSSVFPVRDSETYDGESLMTAYLDRVKRKQVWKYGFH